MALDETIEAPDEAFEIAPAENIAPDRGESRRRSVYEENGEYEFASAHHYVPRYPPRRRTNPME